MSAFSRLFLQHVPKAARIGVAIGGVGASALVYTDVKRERKIAYCESPRYNPNKASLEQLTGIVWPFANGNDQEWPGETEIDLTVASKESIESRMLRGKAQKLIQQRDLLAKVAKKWTDPSYGEWMKDDLRNIDKVASELGQLWKDFIIISNCLLTKAMILHVQDDKSSNEDARMLFQLFGLDYHQYEVVTCDESAQVLIQLVRLASECNGAIYRIGELIGKDEIDANEKLRIQSELHFLHMATKMIVPWLRSYEKMVDEDLDWMYREWLKLEEVHYETLAPKSAKQSTQEEKSEWKKGAERLKQNKQLFDDEKRLKTTSFPQPGRVHDESSSVSNRRSQ